MLRRLLMLLVLVALPATLTACPDEEAPYEESVEEVEDEADDAIND